MKLTRRQEEFVQKMIELKQEFEGPVRYAVLAERLGVSPFTAYDMLCLLEEKGYVTSAYLLPGDKSGPGRAERVFYPGELAVAHQKRILEDMGEMPLKGEALHKYVLEQLLHSGMSAEDRALAMQLMARMLPAGQGEVRYCAEVMTVAALRLQNSAGRQALWGHLPYFLGAPEKSISGEGRACQANLCALGGFVFGVLAQQNEPGQEWLDKLSEHLRGYLEAVSAMGGEQCNQLAAQLATIFARVGAGQ